LVTRLETGRRKRVTKPGGVGDDGGDRRAVVAWRDLKNVAAKRKTSASGHLQRQYEEAWRKNELVSVAAVSGRKLSKLAA